MMMTVVLEVKTTSAKEMTDWAIPQQAKLKYTQLFNLHDRSRSGFLSGLQCRDILLQSGLHRNVLAEIWNLSDIDGDGQLTREEFILAMHLTNQVRAGQNLPTELPQDLVPPSYRRARSISATSVNSATSASSSVSGSGNNEDQLSQRSSETAATAAAGSVLNTNSFEDKRRENFEKGRAELERRRLKIIEQQSSIIKEQLEASKKQVAEAKAKIDSMRSERDTKMGLITSLEAQLKTVLDRKAYLQQEELNLIAIASQKEPIAIASQKESIAMAFQEEPIAIASQKELIAMASQEEPIAIASQKKPMRRYRALYAFEARNPDELTIEPGDTITGSGEVCEPGWLSGETGGRIGLFPEAYVEPLEDEQENFSTSLQDNSTNQNQLIESLQKSLTITPANKYRVLYAFEARNPDELTIEPGDVVTEIEGAHEPEWLCGELNGRKGLFPEAYVEKMPEENIQQENQPGVS